MNESEEFLDLKTPENPDKNNPEYISLKLRIIYCLIAWGLVLVLISPFIIALVSYDMRMLAFFPCGLYSFFIENFNKHDAYIYFNSLIFLMYASSTVMLLQIKTKKLFYILFYILLSILLINVAGCYNIARSISFNL